MKQLKVHTRAEWRSWLSRQHDTRPEVWLVFNKRATGKPSIGYEDAVEEALCFGWIDSIIKKLDEKTYARKFTPRKNKSQWSADNRRRAERAIKKGLMTEAGRQKIRAAKKLGTWETDNRPGISFDMPEEFARALESHFQAKKNFANLAPTYQKQYISWIAVAKREDTRKRRINESIALLEKGEKLGLK